MTHEKRIEQIINELERDNSNEYIAHAIIADITETPLAYVKPKPLVWDKHPDFNEFYSLPQSDLCGTSEYMVLPICDGSGLFVLRMWGEELDEKFPTYEAAQAAAYDDLCKRVKELF